jgi:hypothetical protein
MISRFQKSLKKRFGHSAPRLTVKAHMSTRMKLGLAATGVAVMAGLVWGGFDYGRILGGFNIGKIEEERLAMKADIARLSEENEALKKSAITHENEAKIATGAKDALQSQFVSLQTEVTQLREEVSFFQKLTAGSVKDGGLSIQKLQVQKEADGDNWRVRALVTQGASGGGEFKGTLQLAVNVERDGKRVNLNLPEDQKETTDSLKLTFKNYQRIDTLFKVPAGGQVKSVQAKLLERGTSSPRAQANLSL